MLWVTWRQHRGLLIGVLLTSGVAVPGMLYAGLKIRHDYAIVAACHPAQAVGCQNLDNWFNTDWHHALAGPPPRRLGRGLPRACRGGGLAAAGGGVGGQPVARRCGRGREGGRGERSTENGRASAEAVERVGGEHDGGGGPA